MYILFNKHFFHIVIGIFNTKYFYYINYNYKQITDYMLTIKMDNHSYLSSQ